MKVCIPTADERGLESEPVDHFGSAPFFTMLEIDSGELEVVRNPQCGHHDHHDHHGQPGHHVDQLKAHSIDALVCNGVGRRAFAALQTAGIDVLVPAEGTVADVARTVAAGGTRKLSADEACGGGGRGRHRGASGGQRCQDGMDRSGAGHGRGRTPEQP